MRWSTLCTSKSIGGMGFRDLQQFNQALLVKQVWRLVHQKETLLFKVFKVKFFPDGTIFDAGVPTNCSYAWRSILQATEVILKGAIWRVGDGASINIWEHRWLPNTASNKVLSPQGSANVVWVKELLVPNSGIWNLDLLDRTFIPWEAKEIKRIHVCAHG